MVLALKRPLIVFDLETTGTDPRRDRIIELAAIKLRPDGSREEKVRRFNPGISIPKEASLVHGIYDVDVKDEPHFIKVARGERGVASFFSGCDLAGYNIINFDIPMLTAELERADERLDMSRIAVVDVYRIFYKKEPRDLSGAVRFYLGRTHGSAHEALGDASATLEVLEAQLKRYPELPSSPCDIDHATRNPEDVDRRGKLTWVNGDISIHFGRHKGKTLKQMTDEEPDYIRWMIDNKIAEDAEHYLRDALLGHFARKDDPRPM